ncbi:unnamed protein product [Adineta steineri]|uniref:Cullin neddylation domain-containing protein n=1 Tax=Adineta steineri TaxID=433720 RepID=A0A818HEZ4_9BILA|nr:unnamed protein product [Adineta steineri]
MVKWKEVIGETFGTRMTRTCLDCIENERKHETIDSEPIKVVIESYIDLGDKLYNIRLGENNPKKLSVYKEYFEILFLRESEQFYTCEAAKFTSADLISEYIKQVAQRLTEEEHRVKSYLHSSTLGSLLFILDDVLIRNKLDLIYAGAEFLLHNDKKQDLTILFDLLSRVPGAIEKLKEIVEKHIYLTGLQVIENIAETALTDAKVYITKIIKIYNKYLFLIHECFGGERSSFIGVLNSACSKFINKNAITEASGISTEACGASIKSAELLARYSDIVLKTSDRTRINFNKALQTIDKETTKGVLNTTDKDRKHAVDLVIVRIMQHRKILSHTILVQEVTDQLRDRFLPEISLIQKRIEDLTDRGYLKRNSDDMNILEYVA